MAADSSTSHAAIWQGFEQLEERVKLLLQLAELTLGANGNQTGNSPSASRQNQSKTPRPSYTGICRKF
jgi:hypothetical protein